MDPVSVLPAIFALLIALLTVKLISVLFKFEPSIVKHPSIDGLRAYLAFFVFLHHSAIWYFYLRTNVWDVPPSNLYTHFGHTSVAMFFMITGFLFFSKIMEGKERPVDWIKLYVARVMRLLPLYLAAMLFFVIIVFALSGFIQQDSTLILIKKIIIWCGFSIMGTPDINAVAHTRYIIAGVTWSLVYEWLFYFSLPVFALILFRVKSPIVIFILAILAMLFIIHYNYFQIINLSSFLGGIAAAFLIRIEKFREFASGISSSFLVILCLVLAVVFYPSSYSLIPMGLISIAFVLIACGNTLFGALTSIVSRVFGQMAYSIYLLHGILLFVIFNFVLGTEAAKNLSVINHWLIIGAGVPVLILLCFMAHIYIELPFMNASQKVSDTIKKLLRIKIS